MRILVATPYLFPRGGGLERYAHTLAGRLAGMGHDVVEIGHSGSPLDEREGALRRVGLAPRWRLSNTPVDPRLHAAARDLLRRERFDVVSVHTPVPGTAELAALAARRARVPYVVTYHAGTLAAPRGSPLALAAWLHRRTFERALLRGADGRVAVSGYVARHVYRRLPSDVVPPGVDAERFRPGLDETPGRILFVGPVSRAYAWKGLAALFEAFVLLARNRPEVHLRAVGEGDLADAYRAKARELGLASRFEVTGRVPDDALPGEYRRASVVVLPSTSAAESFGMVLAEANACGRAVVGSDVGGIPCFVEDGVNGLLARPGDARDLAAKLAILLDDADLRRRLGDAGRAKVERAHRWDALAKETAAVLERAAARGTA